MAASHLPHILGLAYGYILFGVPGQSVKFVPLQPSSVPFAEIASVKAEPGKAPTVRKKRPPGKGGPAKPRNQQDVHNDEVPGHLAPKFKPAVCDSFYLHVKMNFTYLFVHIGGISDEIIVEQ